MLPTSPTLIDAAQSSSATPAVRVRWSDLDAGVPRLRWSRWYPNAQGEGGEGDGPAGVALPADGSLVRARIDPATSILYVQRVADPSEDSDYSVWSSLGSAEASAGLGLHAAGTRVLVGYFDGSAVRVRESTDSGATFGSATAVAFTSGVTAIGCAVRAGGTALVAWASGDELWTSTRSGGSWGPPVAWAHDLASFSGLAVAD